MNRYSIFVIVLLMNTTLFSSAASAGTCAVPANAAELVAKAGQMLNSIRSKQGKRALQRDPRLQAAAQAHACDMAVKGYFSHRGKDGSTPKRRLRRKKCNASFVGENIAAGQTSPQDLIQSWMNSPGHRKIMTIGRRASVYGVGVVKSGKAYKHGYVWVLVVSRGC